MNIASTSDNSISWTNNVFYGWIDSTWDALLILEAARKGIVPRVTRRFHDLEKRNMIRSGAVIVFTEEESGIKRWTDPYVWSASRMLGNFMIYREREDSQDVNPPVTNRSAMHKPKEGTEPVDPDLERRIFGSWRRGKGLKKEGLMKKTFSLVVDDATYHLISYYNPADVRSHTLRSPSSIPHLASLTIGPEFTSDPSQFRQPPGDAESKSPTTMAGSVSESNFSDISPIQPTSSEPYPISPTSSISSPTLTVPPTPSSQWARLSVGREQQIQSSYASSYLPQSPQIPHYNYSAQDRRLQESYLPHSHPSYSSSSSQYVQHMAASSQRPYTFNHHRLEDHALTSQSMATSRGTYTAYHDGREDYALAPIRTMHRPSVPIPHSSSSQDIADYTTYPYKIENYDDDSSHSCVSAPPVISPQPITPINVFPVRC